MPDADDVPAQPAEPDIDLSVALPDDRSVAMRDVVKVHRTAAGATVALDAVSLDVANTGFTVVAGTTGAGVSSLLHLIACLDRPDAGTVWVAGLDVTAVDRAARREHRRRSIGLVGSAPHRDLLPRHTVAANLTWAAKRRTGATMNRSGVDAHLEMVGLAGTADRRVGQLSAGEAQRLALACALVGEPRLIVADDPTARLDRSEATRFTNSLRDASDRGACVVAGTTDAIVVAAADRTIALTGGRLA